MKLMRRPRVLIQVFLRLNPTLAEIVALLVAVPSIVHPVKQHVKHKSVTEQTNHDQCNH
jgi:hypothetical protein